MKAKILSEKGTISKQVEIEPVRWAEKAFYVAQEEFFGSLPSGTIISLGKGTGNVLAADYKKSPKRIHVGSVTITTNRGTSRCKLP